MGRSSRVDLSALGPGDAGRLSGLVAAAGLVCFPTDTVYGVGGRLAPEVGMALAAAKGRDPGKPLQVIFPSRSALEAQVPLPPRLLAACRALLPGPLTLVVPYPPGWTFPSPAATLGVRVPVWPEAAGVLAALSFALVASSANPSGAPPPASLEEVDPELLARCDLVLDGGRVTGVASTVVDLSAFADDGHWRILRAGAQSEAEVARRLGALDPPEAMT